MFAYFCIIHYAFVFHYFSVCRTDKEIVENVDECLADQAKVVNDGLSEWSCNFQT